MNSWLFRARLRLARRRAVPSRPFRRRLWGRLSATLQARRVPSSVWYRTRGFRLAISSFSSLAVCASFATGAYAYASPTVGPDSILYPVKRQIETVEERLQRTPNAKAEFYLKTIRKRESEAVVERIEHKSTRMTEAEIKSLKTRLRTVSAKLDRDDPATADLEVRIRRRLEKPDRGPRPDATLLKSSSVPKDRNRR